jgi:deoxyribonuclease-4
MSIAGGVDIAFDRGEQVGCEAMQIFTKSNNQWRARPLREQEIARYHERQTETGITPVVSHASYLLNLGTPDDNLWEKSYQSLLVEMERCDTLSIPYLVIHPGAHVGSGTEAGLRRVADALDRVARERPDLQVMVCIEGTAGQGTTLCHRFEEIAELFSLVSEPERLGVCLDTCHLFAAGYELRNPAGYEETITRFNDLLGLHRLKVWHFNDSKKGLASRVDRHMHIGEGELGLEPFRLILNDPRFSDLPGLLETPKSPDMHEDVENLKRLKDLIEHDA